MYDGQEIDYSNQTGWHYVIGVLLFIALLTSFFVVAYLREPTPTTQGSICPANSK